MDDSSLFMQWAVNTLQHQHPAAVDEDEGDTTFPSLQALGEASDAAVVAPELTEAHGANSWSFGGWGFSSAATSEHGGWSTFSNLGWLPAPSSSGTNLPMSWNFSAASAQPSSDGMVDAGPARAYDSGVPEKVYGSPPTRRASVKSAELALAPYAQGHIMVERKRREKINQRFIELSRVIPGLKKMDKGTILSDAARYVKELQEKVKSLESGSNDRRIETVVLVKKPCIAAPDDDGSPRSSSAAGAPARNPLPEIDARFSENNVMVRIHCENSKGMVVRVLAEVEELHLSITYTNIMPFPACTSIITITAKVEEGFTVTAEEIVGRLKLCITHQGNSTTALYIV